MVLEERIPQARADRNFQRSTRGKRMNAALAADEEEADNEFWNQDFFQEEAQDNEYEAEDEKLYVDIVDSDFDDEVSRRWSGPQCLQQDSYRHNGHPHAGGRRG